MALNSNPLAFCDDCGSLRLRDVTDQLQELFIKQFLKPDVCGICKNTLAVREKSSQKPENCKSAEQYASNKQVMSKEQEITDDTSYADVNFNDRANEISSNIQVKREVQEVDDTTSGTDEYDCTNEAADSEATKDHQVNEVCQQIVKTELQDPDTSTDASTVIHNKTGDVDQDDTVEMKRRTRLSTGTMVTPDYRDFISAKNNDSTDDNTDIDDDDMSEEFIPDELVKNKTQNNKSSDDNTDIDDDDMSEEFLPDELVKNKTGQHENDSDHEQSSDIHVDLSEYIVKNNDVHVKAGQLKCDMCSYTASKMLYMERHKQQKHGSSKGPFICEPCNCVFMYRYRLDNHKQANQCKRLHPTKPALHVKPPDAPNPALHDDISEVTRFLNAEVVALMGRAISIMKPFRCKHCPLKEFKTVIFFLKHLKNSHFDLYPEIDTLLKKGYQCDLCNKCFHDLKTLKNHQEVHMTLKPYKCVHPGCSEACKSKRRLSMHVRRAHSIKEHPSPAQHAKPLYALNQALHVDISGVTKPYKCDQCNKCFRDLRTVKNHQEVHMTLKPYKCVHPGCSEACKSKRRLSMHVRRAHSKKEHPSPALHAKPLDAPNLTAHVDISEVTRGLNADVVALMGRARSLKMPFRCKHCHLREFKTANFFLKHLKDSHFDLYPEIDNLLKKGYKCALCNKCFRDLKTIERHQEVHTNVKPYKCDHPGCGKASKTKRRLNMHVKRKHGERKHKCSTCDSRYESISSLRIHVNSAHLNIRPHKCSYCDHGFPDERQRQKHEDRVHLKLKKAMCDTCGHSFATLTDLQVHSRIHTGEKPYKCDQCDYRCTISNSLQRHKRSHTGEKPYQCEKCGKAFTYRKNLIPHMRRHHGSFQTEQLVANGISTVNVTLFGMT